MTPPGPRVLIDSHRSISRWADEHGYWMGELSYFGPDLAPNHDPDRWNYPYDHYKGFITGSVAGGSYSQREPRHHIPSPSRPELTLLRLAAPCLTQNIPSYAQATRSFIRLRLLRDAPRTTPLTSLTRRALFMVPPNSSRPIRPPSSATKRMAVAYRGPTARTRPSPRLLAPRRCYTRSGAAIPTANQSSHSRR